MLRKVKKSECNSLDPAGSRELHSRTKKTFENNLLKVSD